MAKFVVGDRVRAYTSDLVYTGKVQITWAVAGTSLLPIQLDNGATLYFHAKQCRKLVKKKPRRSVWFHKDNLKALDDNGHFRDLISSKQEFPSWVEFVEKRRKGAKRV